MRPVLASAAAAMVLGGLVPALVILTAAVLVHAARSPDRLLDVAYLAVFCGAGYLAS